MCLELVKSAKGEAAVNYVKSVAEPSATDQPKRSPQTAASKVPTNEEKGKKTNKRKLDINAPGKPLKPIISEKYYPFDVVMLDVFRFIIIFNWFPSPVISLIC